MLKKVVNMSLLSCLYLIFLNLECIWAQETIGSTALQEDLTIIGEIIKEVSPKMTEEDRIAVDSILYDKKKELEGQSMSPWGFFDFLTNIDFETKFDEHGSLGIDEEVLMALLDTSKLFPLPLKFIENSVVVNSSEMGILPFGSIIHAIDSIPMDSLIKFGETQFSILYLIKKGSQETFEVEFSYPSDSSIFQKSIKGIDFQEYLNQFDNTVYPLNESELSNLINTQYYQEINTYYLQLNSFSWNDGESKGLFDFLKGTAKKFDKKFEPIFKEIQASEATNLILDLRYNGGGNVEVPAVLFEYLALQPFEESIFIETQDFVIPYPEYIREVNGESMEEERDFQKFIKQYQKLFNATDSTLTWILVNNETRQPNKYAFGGNVYLLVGEKTLSASSYFTALYRAADRGVIIGEEIGGSHHAITAGKILNYQLPHTKIEIEAPMMIVSFSKELYTKVPEKKVLPDILLTEEERLQYFLEKKDPELEKVMELIKEAP